MWEKEYKNKKYYWGLKPNPTLKKNIHLIPKGKALDIGAGEGKNSIFLAKNGFEVEAIDRIAEGLKKCKKLAENYKLPIKTKVCDMRKFDFGKNRYSLVVSSAALDFLKKTEIESIINKIKKSLISDGFIYLLVFSEKDPLHQKIKKSALEEIEKNTYYLPKYKTYRHFFTKEEIKKSFNDFKIIYFKKKKIKDTGHSKPHFHNIIELLAQKK